MADPTRPKTTSKIGQGLAVGAALVLVAGALAPPFLGAGARFIVEQAFAPVCHQLPGRSFAIGGVTLAVCHRCFGIYVGVLAGTLAWPFTSARVRGWIGRRAGWVLVAAGAPAVVDWSLGVLGWWANTALTQTSSGAVLGLVLGLLLARAATHAATGHVIPEPTSHSSA